MLIKRDLEFERALAEKLMSVDWTGLDTWDAAMLLNGAAKVWSSTESEEFGNILVNGLKKRAGVLTAAENAAEGGKELAEGLASGCDTGDLCNFMFGNACYAALDFTGDDVYAKAARKLAEQFDTQKRSKDGYFLNKEESACICDTFCSQVFYMNYETRDGGKERYNDIIAQYNSVHEKLYPNAVSEKAYEPLSYYCAALIDTMEVMDQPLYEIYRKLQDYFKESVKAVLNMKYGADGNSEGAEGKAASGCKAESACGSSGSLAAYELIFAYAVLKGCRMKALHTEKYEALAEDLYNKLPDIKSVDFANEDGATLAAACAYVYSEAVRNREYQDYGRGKGGVLWS